MRRKRGNTNIKILQSQIQNFAIQEDAKLNTRGGDKKDEESKQLKGSGVTPIELPIIEKLPKKKGVPKNELINTRRLLTM